MRACVRGKSIASRGLPTFLIQFCRACHDLYHSILNQYAEIVDWTLKFLVILALYSLNFFKGTDKSLDARLTPCGKDNYQMTLKHSTLIKDKI